MYFLVFQYDIQGYLAQGLITGHIHNASLLSMFGLESPGFFQGM